MTDKSKSQTWQEVDVQGLAAHRKSISSHQTEVAVKFTATQTLILRLFKVFVIPIHPYNWILQTPKYFFINL